ncbi:unnamed protein product [Arctogadus glacialis]
MTAKWPALGTLWETFQTTRDQGRGVAGYLLNCPPPDRRPIPPPPPPPPPSRSTLPPHWMAHFACISTYLPEEGALHLNQTMDPDSGGDRVRGGGRGRGRGRVEETHSDYHGYMFHIILSVVTA